MGAGHMVSEMCWVIGVCNGKYGKLYSFDAYSGSAHDLLAGRSENKES